MSVRVKLDSLTDSHKKIIREMLYIQPKKTNFTANKFSAVEKDPILFYWIDKPNGEIVLPYTFANALFKRHINSTIIYPEGSFNFTGKLRESQLAPVREALEQLNTKGTTLLSLPTGFGKSICSTYLGSVIMKSGLMMILTNRETIQKGWKETVEQNTDAAVWVVDSKMKIPTTCNVIITMDGKFEKIPWQIRKMVSVLVIDESHLFCTGTRVPVLLGTCPKYVIACTATLERPDGLHVMIENIVGKHRVEVKNNKKFVVYKLNTGIESELVKNKQGTTDFAALTRDLSFNPLRNAYIIDFIEQNKELKFMVLSWSVAHCNLLLQILKERGESVDILAGTKSRYIDSRILIGSVSKISTGFDASNVAENFDGIAIDTIILAGSTKSHNLHIQNIDRVFRSDSPIIIDLVDSNRISLSHWRERKKNYDEMNCEIKEFNLNKKEAKDELSEAEREELHSSRLKAFLDKTKA